MAAKEATAVDKRERFIRVAETRVNRILDELEKLGRCANRRNYEYTDEDVKLIFREIRRKLDEIRSFFGAAQTNSRKFRLKR